MFAGIQPTFYRAHQGAPSDDHAAIRIILVDPHAVVRAGLKELLNSIRGAEVVAEAKDGQELIALARSLPAEMVVMDIALPDMDGIAAIAHLQRLRPELKVVVLTMQAGPEQIRRAVEGGACAFMSKDEPPHNLDYAVTTVMRRGQYFGHEISSRLVQARSHPDELTERQLEVLKLIALGYASKQIGHELGLSSKTVDVHRNRIQQRLRIHDIANLTRYAIRRGLIAA